MEKIIQIENLDKTFLDGRKKRKAVDNLSLQVYQGEVYGFLGLNGAGKSTTIKMLLNFLKPDSGIIKIMGHQVGRDEFRQQIGYLSEFPCFYEHLTGMETLVYAGLFNGMEKKNIYERSTVLLNKMQLSAAAGKKVGAYSKGMKQRLGFATALIHNPDLLILDEPMSGLDPIGRHLIKGIIEEQRQNDKTVFFSSHILSDIEEICDRIGILHNGLLIYKGDLDAFNTAGDFEKSFVKVVEEHNNLVA